VGFVQVRPTPWRQAVDLGNMMLVLAVRTDPDRVYRRALAFFTPDELAEAFAATRGMASPNQLRAFMKRDPRDLLSAFRALAPPRKPIALQRWSIRRVALAVAMFGGIALAIIASVEAFAPAGNNGILEPQCGTGHTMILAAQAGAQALTVTLSAACHISGAQQVASDQPGTRLYERPLSLRPLFAELRFYTFPGGCVTYRLSFASGASSLLAIPLGSAVAFMRRATLVEHVRNTEGLALCGRGAACPG